MRLSVLGTLEFGNFLFGEFLFGHLLSHHSFWIAFKGRVVGQKMTDQMRHFLFLSLALSAFTRTLSIYLTHIHVLSLSLSLLHKCSLSLSPTHTLSLSLKHIDCLFITYPRIQKRTRHMFFLSLTWLTLAHSYSNQHTPRLTHTLTTQTHFITHTESRTRNHAHTFSFILEVDKHVGSNSSTLLRTVLIQD